MIERQNIESQRKLNSYFSKLNEQRKKSVEEDRDMNQKSERSKIIRPIKNPSNVLFETPLPFESEIMPHLEMPLSPRMQQTSLLNEKNQNDEERKGTETSVEDNRGESVNTAEVESPNVASNLASPTLSHLHHNFKRLIPPVTLNLDNSSILISPRNTTTSTALH